MTEAELIKMAVADARRLRVEFEKLAPDFIYILTPSPARWHGTPDEIAAWECNPYDNPYVRGQFDMFKLLMAGK